MNTTKNANQQYFKKGLKNGIPIALGYLAVAFTLGITARNAGMTAWQATLTSLACNASAGEYAGFTVIAAGGTYIEMAIMELVANLRYLLMSASLSQKFSPKTGLLPRLAVGYAVTDEIFGVAVSEPGILNPFYNYGMIAVAIPCWALGTFLGVVMGNILPANIVSALSVGLYGMFIAIIIPPAKKRKLLAALITISMAASYIFSKLPATAGISAGIRTIILTVIIAGLAAILFPIGEETDSQDNARGNLSGES